MYEGMSERKRSCPAVSHNCNRTVLSSRYIVFDKKSMPIVAWEQYEDVFKSEYSAYLIVLIKAIIHESSDDRSLPHSLIPKEYKLVLRQGSDVGCRASIGGSHWEAQRAGRKVCGELDASVVECERQETPPRQR